MFLLQQRYFNWFKAYFWKLLSILIFVSFGFSVAQESDTTNSGLITNPEAAFELELWLDKRYANGEDATYTIGETIEIGLTVGSSAFVYLYNLHSDGTVLQIYPNRFESTNFLSGTSTIYFGIKGDNYHFKAAGPEGTDSFIAIASRKKLNTDSLASFTTSNGVFAVGYQSQESFKANLESLLEPLKGSDWITTSVDINIKE